MVDKETYDFSCWVIKYEHSRYYDRTYKKDSLVINRERIVPLCWNHDHNNPDSVLGWALLEHRDDGIYAYCTLFDIPINETTRQLLKDKGSVALSPYINRIEYEGKIIVYGVIREVSLVLERIDKDEIYYPVLREE